MFGAAEQLLVDFKLVCVGLGAAAAIVDIDTVNSICVQNDKVLVNFATQYTVFTRLMAVP